MEANCVFCMIAKGEIDAQRVYDNEQFIVIKDTNPKVPGHSLVIPREHFVAFENIPENYFMNFGKAVQGAITQLAQETNMEGYNLVMNNHPLAGQIIPHAHLHILPRTSHDNIDIIK